MKLRQMLKRMNDDSVNYSKGIEDYVCIVQQSFSICLALFFALHIIVINLLDFTASSSFYGALWISSLQMAFSLFLYFLFRYYFSVHRKHLLAAAYFNIFQTIIILELQYFLYDKYISYTVIICIVLSTSFAVIGHIRKYTFIIASALFADIIITVIKNCDLLYSHPMKLYIIDNLFVLVVAGSINFCVCWLKYQEFEKTQQIIYLSERDSLTGLLNRKSLESFIQTNSASNALCAMILLDLDNFKTLNDTLGHYEGDRCLQAVSDELTNLFAPTDYVCRLGGDEFVIFMSNIPDTSYAIEKANILLEKIPRNYAHASGKISITCSIGIAFSQANTNNLYEQLYKAADAAMYTSKANGKNDVTIFSDSLSHTSQ